MDGSAYRHLPIGGLLTLAVIGAAALVIGGLGGAGYAIWWIAHHVSIN